MGLVALGFASQKFPCVEFSTCTIDVDQTPKPEESKFLCLISYCILTAFALMIFIKKIPLPLWVRELGKGSGGR